MPKGEILVFQSRNRESSNFNESAGNAVGNVHATFQSRNRESSNFNYISVS